MQKSVNNPYDRKNVENIFPLSPMQQGLLFHTLLAPTSGTYVPQIRLTLKGHLNADAMKQSWQAALDCFSALRCGFFWEQRDEPYQIQFHQLPIQWSEQDWSGQDSESHEARLRTLMDCNRTEPFNLNRPPLMRLHWIRMDADEVCLLWCYHHLILDGWSSAQVLQAVFMDYRNRIEGKPKVLPAEAAPYSTYIRWLKQFDRDAALDYWKARLQDMPALPSLPGQRPRSEQDGQLHEPLYCELKLSREDSDRIDTLLHQSRITLNTLLQGTLALVLRRYGNPGDIVFGTTIAGRPADLPHSTRMIGLFINTLPVRITMNPELNVTDWLLQIQQQQQSTAGFDALSLRDIQGQCNHGNPLFNLLLVVESFPLTESDAKQSGHISLQKIDIDESTHLPLTIQAAPGPQVHLAIRADGKQFDQHIIQQLLSHLKAALLSLVKQPESRLGSVGVLSQDELRQFAAWNQTETPWPDYRSLMDLFEEQVLQHPDQTAIILDLDSSTSALSYVELNKKANALADQLNQYQIGPESIVGVYLERSLELMIALVAIQKCGAAFLPLDTAQPQPRLQLMLEDAKPAAMIFNSNSTGFSTPPKTAEHLFELDTQTCLQNHASKDFKNPDRSDLVFNGDIAAYVLYTSGSTGKPKGVVNTQTGIINRLLWMQQQYQLTQQDRVLQKTPLSFDVSVWELFWPLISGATLVLAKPEGHLDRDYLMGCMEKHKISVAHFVPSMLQDFLESGLLQDKASIATKPKMLCSLRDIICSGEALPFSLQQRVFERIPEARLHNLYGPTEAAIDVTAWECRSDTSEQGTIVEIPIGKPIANTRIHILDDDGFPVPVSAKGTLHIGGHNLARGYLNQPGLTAQRFIESHPTGSGRLYNTGDLASYREDGNILYHGRADDQIKIRGVRIELSEIESVLSQQPEVRQAAARFLRNNDSPNKVGYVVGYVVPVEHYADQQNLSNSLHNTFHNTLLKSLRNHLPAAMIPAEIMVVESIPVTANGKPDRTRLPEPSLQANEYCAARTEQEKLIASIWQECLKLPQQPSVHDHFFQSGGHSLIATRIVNRIRQATGVELPLPLIFEHPTLESLARTLQGLQNPQTDSAPRYREISL